MQRAAYGLAHAVIDVLGTAYGRRVLLLVGGGNNGGDALYAGAVLARRGVQVEAWLVSGTAHEAGARGTPPGGRAGRAGADAPARPRRRRRRRHRRAPGTPRRRRSGPSPRSRACRSSRSTPPAVSTSTPVSSTAPTSTPWPPSRSAPTRSPTWSTRRPPRPARSTSSTSGSTLAARRGRSPPARRRGRTAAPAGPGVAEVLTRASSASVPALPPIPARGCCRWPAPRAGWSAWSATSATSVVARPGAPAHPEVVGDGRVQAWIVGSGSGDGAEQTLRDALEDDVPVVVDADALMHAPRTPPAHTILTPHAGELARMLGVDRGDVEAAAAATRPHARPRSTAPPCCSRADAHRGRHPDGRVRVNTTGHPVAGHRRRRRRARRTRRRPRRRRARSLRRRVGGLVAARRRRHPRPPRAGRSSPATSRAPCPASSRRSSTTGDGTIDAHEPARPRRDRRRPRGDPAQRAPAARRHTGVAMITVVKADAYGHGMLPVARAAREAGAEWLAVATLDEVRALRASGDTGRLLTWLTVPGEQYDDAIRADVDLTAYSVDELDEIAAAAADVGPPGPRAAQGRHRPQPRRRRSRGLGGVLRPRPRRRGGRPLAGHRPLVAPRLRRRARPPGQRRPGGAPSARRSRSPSEAGLAARAPPPRQLRGRDPAAQRALRRRALRHRDATASTRPRRSPTALDLRPAMTVRADLALVKHLDAGDSVSYGHTWTADRAHHRRPGARSGYGEGVPRAASNAPRSPSTASAARSAAGSAWTRCSSTSAATRRRRRHRRRALRPARRRPADRPGLGRGLRHHQLRDRHPHRRTHAPPLRRQRAAQEHRMASADAGSSARSAARSASPPPAPPSASLRQQRAVSRARRRERRRSAPLHSDADHRGRRRRRAPARRGRRGRDARRRRAVAWSRAAPAVTVVFAHGYCLNLDCWHFQRAAYRGLVRTVYYDQRSHGRSGRSDREHATIDQLGHDLKQILDAGRARRAGRAGRPLDGRDDDRRAGRALPRADRRPGHRRRPDLHHRRRPRPEPDPAADAARPPHRRGSPTAPSPPSPRGHRAVDQVRRVGR